MHGYDDPITEATMRADAADDPTAPSEVMEEALAAGTMLGARMAEATRGRLDPATRERLERTVAGCAAGGAYAGMALWALNAFTVGDERTGRFAEALAGLGVGLLSAPR